MLLMQGARTCEEFKTPGAVKLSASRDQLGQYMTMVATAVTAIRDMMQRQPVKTSPIGLGDHGTGMLISSLSPSGMRVILSDVAVASLPRHCDLTIR